MNVVEIDYIRLWLSFVSGGLLSVSGSLIQGITQNELAGPSTLGINALIILFLLVAHFVSLGWGGLSFFASEEIGMILFFLFLLLSIFIFRRKKDAPLFYGNKVKGEIPFFILIGLCFNLFVGALFSVIQFFLMTLNVEFPTQIWYGNFRFYQPTTIYIIGLGAPLLFVWVYFLSKKLRPLTYGADFALGLGVNVRSVQQEAFLVALIATSLVGLNFGIFAFTGLIFPHLLRSFNIFKSDIKKEVLFGPIICGVIFMGLDLFCAQCTFYGAEIPVGLVSALIGTVLLLVLLLKRKMTFYLS